jgi:hypothetical protein
MANNSAILSFVLAFGEVEKCIERGVAERREALIDRGV